MVMKTLKIVGTRTPEKLNVNLEAIPPNESDALCRAILHGMAAIFEDPAVRADYENWKKQRELRKEAAAT